MTSDDTPSWERRHQVASFYQAQLSDIQRGAIAAQAGTPLVLLVMSQLVKFPAPSSPEQWTYVFMAVFVWAIITLVLFRSGELEATRVLLSYEMEHARLFSDLPPIRLTSYLLGQTYRRRAKARIAS